MTIRYGKRANNASWHSAATCLSPEPARYCTRYRATAHLMRTRNSPGRSRKKNNRFELHNERSVSGLNPVPDSRRVARWLDVCADGESARLIAVPQSSMFSQEIATKCYGSARRGTVLRMLARGPNRSGEILHDFLSRLFV